LAILRVLAPLAYAGVAVVVFALRGVPLDRGMLSLGMLGLLFCLSLGSLRDFSRSLLVDWVPLLAALTLYDVLRGAGGGRVPIHGYFQIWLDKWIFGFGHVPTVWLQQHLWDPAHIDWVDVFAWAVYMPYFIVTPIVLMVLWLGDRPAFRRYARCLTLLSFASVACFTAWPSMPPWLAAQKGMIGPTDRLVGTVGERFPWWDPTPLWERGLRLANDLAAFPSLHEGMTVLLVLLLWHKVPRWFRLPLALYPLAMGFALVYSGEHYVTDLVAGAALTVLDVRLEPRLTRAAVGALARVRSDRTVPETG